MKHDYELTPTQRNIIIYSENIISAISVLGCLFVILVFSIVKKYRTFPLQLVFFLCVAELFNHMSTFINPDPSMDEVKNVNCEIQAFLRIYFEGSSLIWTYFIALTALFSIVQDVETFKKYEKIYLFIYCTVANVIPAIFTIM